MCTMVISFDLFVFEVLFIQGISTVQRYYICQNIRFLIMQQQPQFQCILLGLFVIELMVVHNCKMEREEHIVYKLP